MPRINSSSVSIILPVYNAASFVAEAIASVRAQTFADWELLIVDDGSTDATAAVLARQDDPRIRVLHQQNAGVSAARNAALDIATGEFVTFLDADDRLPPDALMHRVSYLQANPQVDIVNGGVRITRAGNTQRIYSPSTVIMALFPGLAALDERFFFGPFYMLRLCRIGSHRFPVGTSHCEDLCFFLELADDADLVYGAVDNEIYEYRLHENSAMGNMDGIETGYLALIKLASKLKKMTPRRSRAMKFRISSIMMKCWLRKANPLRALGSVFKVWMTRA